MDEKLSRRTFLEKSVKGVTGIVVTGVSLPLLTSACAPAKKPEATRGVSTESMIDLGTLEEIEKGDFPKKVEYNTTIKDGWATVEKSGFVYINKDNQGELLVMSPICTHLGCTVPYADEEKQKQGIKFFCPCHGGQYDEMGVNIGGPPPRPLDVFRLVVQDGHLYIQMMSPIKRQAKT